jgi:hypothetical protein
VQHAALAIHGAILMFHVNAQLSDRGLSAMQHLPYGMTYHLTFGPWTLLLLALTDLNTNY